MSKDINLLYKSVGKKKDEQAKAFDPVDNIETLHKVYPESCVCLSMLSFNQEWKQLLPALRANVGDGDAGNGELEFKRPAAR